MEINLVLGAYYSKEEIESAFNTNFGNRIKGINLRRTAQSERYIILFATVRGAVVYGDRIFGNIFYYKGEGTNGDQRMTTANSALINSNRDNRAIFGFRQDELRGKYRFLGIVSVLDWAYVKYEGRNVYEFKLQQEGIENIPEHTSVLREIINTSDLPSASLTGSTQRIESTTSTIARNSAFRLQVKKLYQNRCAICKKLRVTVSEYPEVQSAHIYPKEKNGSDDFRNGIALCRLHHWAFDGGLISITDDLKIMVRANIKLDPDYEEICRYEGKKLSLPTEIRYKPLPLFLSEHRRMHGFE